MKKVLALVLALALLLSVTSAFAATIQVQNVINGETYTAYKLLNVRDNGETGNARKVTYYLTASEYNSIGSVLEAAGFAFTASADGTEYFVNNAASFDPAGAAEYLGSHTSDLGSALGTATATGAGAGEDGTGGSATFTGLATGYYFVTSSAGSLCALHEDTAIATAVEKNTIPTIDKKEKVAAGDSFVDGPVDANIGDTVYYQIVVTDGVGTDAQLTVTDTLSAGLDYTAGTLTIDGSSVADDANVADNYVVTVSGRTITIVFAPAFVAGKGTGETITITLNATINENAVIDSATGNENKVELNYSNQHSEDKVYVETYDFIVYKTDGTNFLDGAEFKLYDAATGGSQILLADEGNGEYVKDATASADVTIDINSGNGCHVRGLAPGTYYLEEVVVPGGYNKLSAREEVTISSGATAAVEITVVNNAGSELPSTGGIGTTIFYIAGLVLILGAAAVVIARRKAEQE